MSACDVLVAGHICLDITPSCVHLPAAPVSELLIPGHLINVGGVTVSAGGPVSNTGQALERLGLHAQLMGKIGRDLFGETIQRLLGEKELGASLRVVEGEHTAYTIVIAVPGSDRIYLHHPGANDTFCADDLDYDMIRGAKIFHLGYPPLMRRLYEDDGRELIEIFRSVKALGVTTSLDMSLPDSASASGAVAWDGVLRALLPHVDLFLPSIEETLYMLRRDAYAHWQQQGKTQSVLEHIDLNILQELGAQLLDYGAKIAMIKCGVNGAYLRSAPAAQLAVLGDALHLDLAGWGERELLAESHQVADFASATGAGDCCIAGFHASLLHGESLEMALRIACAVGGQSVRAYDAASALQPWEATRAAVAQDTLMYNLDIPGGYWQYQPAIRLWTGARDRVLRGAERPL